MGEQRNFQVIELRNYLLNPNVRSEFADYFNAHLVKPQNALGGNVLGRFAVKGDDDKFFWIRGFADMQTRSAFLPEFYYGETWKKFGAAANEMMIDSDDVYLLKPIDELQAFRKNKFLKLDYYFAQEEKIESLIEFFQTKCLAAENSEIGNVTFWRSELAENDFPRLPAFQHENLLVVLRAFDDEKFYQSELAEIDSVNFQLKRFIVKKESLLLSEI